MLFVGICALGEWFTCVFHVPDNVYRLLFYRYLFLFVFRLCKIKLNVWVCGLALIALFLAIFRDIYFCRFDCHILRTNGKDIIGLIIFILYLCFSCWWKLYNYIMKSRLSVFFCKIG